MNRFLHLILFATAALLVSNSTGAVAPDARGPKPFWFTPPYPQPEPQDTQTAFRGSFDLTSPAEIEIRILGASQYNVWINGIFLVDGPPRFPREHPEFDVLRTNLPAGNHTLAVQVHYDGVDTRTMRIMPPFLACEVYASGAPLIVRWRAFPMPGVRATSRRRSPILGWMEWIDTRPMPDGWREPGFNDSAWLGVLETNPGLGPMRPLSIASVPNRSVQPRLLAQGPLARWYSPNTDDPPVAFFLADLRCKTVPAQGVWRRYDLGKVRIARPRFVLDLPPGAVVEFGSSEELRFGRVSPWSGLSGSPTCFVDHYIARGGTQEFFPMQPQGARFYEVHIYGDPGAISFVKEEFVEKAYYDEPIGSFRCGDKLLERIWKTGIETARSSSEDAIVDSRRERGQWTGDLFVGMRILATSYADLRLARRGIVQSALCARDDGMVAALCPGVPDYIPGYSAQWISAVLDYWQLTGDRELLEEMYPYAEKNLTAMLARLGPAGVTNGLGWNFIDWGYVPNEGDVEIVLNLQILEALRSMVRWCNTLDKSSSRYEQSISVLEKAMRDWFARQLAESGSWTNIGYQRAVFGLKLDLIPRERAAGAVSYIKGSIQSRFPSDRQAARLADPNVTGDFFTPYFANFALPELVRRGETDFVLEQYRQCWGWFLEQGLTTWPEVFDLRWSHCHQWSGSPTWVLSRYVLGLHPREDKGQNHFDLELRPGSLKQASGDVALRNGKTVSVSWRRTSPRNIVFRASADCPVQLHLSGRESLSIGAGQPVRIELSIP